MVFYKTVGGTLDIEQVIFGVDFDLQIHACHQKIRFQLLRVPYTEWSKVHLATTPSKQNQLAGYDYRVQ